MTKEELEKEAKEYADWFWGASPSMMKALAEVYIKGAEPREKRIADLEKKNAKLKEKLEKHKWNDIFLEDCAVYDKKIAEEYTNLQEQILKLEKENAELKKTVEYYRKEREFFIGEVSE